MNSRIKKIYEKLGEKNLDGMLVSFPPNITYLTNYVSRDSYLVISKKDNIYITDSRYTEEAKSNLGNDFGLKKIDGSVFKTIADICNRLGLKRMGFEERYFPFAEHGKVKEGLNGKAVLVPTHSLVESMRQIKSIPELEKIKKATGITISAFRFIKDAILPGKKEIEIAGEIERFIRYQGARNSSFDIIVASGANSSFPHHLTSDRKIKINEPVTVDMGVEYLGYKTDLTRVFFSGKINTFVRKIYGIVQRAQDLAIAKIRPGVFISKIDAAARSYIARKGYGRFFGHNLGHGIGLEVHEEPHISGKENGRLKEGMVFTVEPAVYLPGKFGIRLEDMVLVTRKGCEVLSGSLNK